MVVLKWGYVEFLSVSLPGCVSTGALCLYCFEDKSEHQTFNTHGMVVSVELISKHCDNVISKTLSLSRISSHGAYDVNVHSIAAFHAVGCGHSGYQTCMMLMNTPMLCSSSYYENAKKK